MNFRTRRLTPFTAILMLVLCLALTPAFAAAAKKKADYEATIAAKTKARQDALDAKAKAREEAAAAKAKARADAAAAKAAKEKPAE